jgi:YD repeat-containing protein
MSYTYDGLGQLATFTDPLNHTTTLSGYQRGLPTLVTYPDQTTEQIGVDAFGEVASLTDQNGNATTYSYDSVGRLGQISYPAGDTVAWAPKVFAYSFVGTAEQGVDAGHWRRTVTQGDGTATNYTQVTYFDALLRPMVAQRFRTIDGAMPTTTVTVHDWKGNTTFQSYAVDGLQAYNSSAVTNGITTNYDALSRAIQTIQPSEDLNHPAAVTTTGYPGGARKQVTDPNNNTTTTTYQVFDEAELKNAVKVEAPEGVVQQITRDLYGNPQTVIQGGVTKSMVYDSFKRVCRTFEPETMSTVTSFDAANNIVWSAKGQNITEAGCGYDQVLAAAMVSRTYDTLNRVTKVTYGDGVTPEGDFSYTPSGKPLTEASGTGAAAVQWLFTYNKRDLTTGESLSVDGHVWPVGLGYDVNGVVAAVSYPDGKAVPFAPDAFGRPTQAGTYATAASYFPDDQLLHFTLGNGVDYLAERNTRQLLSDFSYTQGTTLALSEGFKYDPNANITELDDLVTSGQRSRTFSYDGLNRLKAAASGLWGSDTYNYDVLNNLTSIVSGTQTNTYTYDATNKLTSIGGGSVSRTFAYDVRGNVTTNGTAHYAFDQADRLTSVNTSTDKYTYDAEGRRVKAVGSGATTYSLYTHDGQLLWQFNPSGNNGTDYIYLGKKLVARTDSVAGAGSPVPVAPATITPVLSADQQTITVTWPASSGATYYIIRPYGPEPGAGVDNTVQGLSKSFPSALDGDYTFQVRACNITGCGLWTISTGLNFRHTPGTPASITVPATSTGAIAISWSAPAYGLTYDLQQSSDSVNYTSIYSGENTFFTQTVSSGGTYYFRVRACNSGPCGGYSPVRTSFVSIKPTTSPTVSVPGTNTTGCYTVNWTLMAGATSYVLQEKVGTGAPVVINNDGSGALAVCGKATGSYSYRAEACNAAGCGPLGTYATVNVTVPPPVPTGVQTTRTLTGTTYRFTGSWSTVAGATSYEVLTGTSTVYSGTALSYILQNGTSAALAGAYSVRACNSTGCSAYVPFPSP